MNAVIYAKYNSHIQSKQAIKGQLEKCYDFANENNYNIIGEYLDVSNREQFNKMIKDSSKKEFQAVIVYSLDRFTRNRFDLITYKLQLKQNGVKLISATENLYNSASDIHIKSILEAMTQYYSAELDKKIKRQMET